MLLSFSIQRASAQGASSASIDGFRTTHVNEGLQWRFVLSGRTTSLSRRWQGQCRHGYITATSSVSTIKCSSLTSPFETNTNHSIIPHKQQQPPSTYRLKHSPTLATAQGQPEARIPLEMAGYYGYADRADYTREYREQRAHRSTRMSGEYHFYSYADENHSTHAPSSSVYESYDTYDSGYGSSRSDMYDVPPTPRGRSGKGRQPSFDTPLSHHGSFESDDMDNLRDRFSKTRIGTDSYTRRHSPSPMRRRVPSYDADFDHRNHRDHRDYRTSEPSRGPRWVAAVRIQEGDENDPRLNSKPRAPYVYTGTTDPDGTFVDKPRSSRRESRAYGHDAGHSSGSYSRGSPSDTSGGSEYSGASGDGYSRATRGSASHRGYPYDDYLYTYGKCAVARP
jgi:hypothetical protein